MHPEGKGVTTARPWNGDFARSNVAARMHAFANNYGQRFDDCARLMASGRFLLSFPRVLSRVSYRLCHGGIWQGRNYFLRFVWREWSRKLSAQIYNNWNEGRGDLFIVFRRVQGVEEFFNRCERKWYEENGNEWRKSFHKAMYDNKTKSYKTNSCKFFDLTRGEWNDLSCWRTQRVRSLLNKSRPFQINFSFW